MSNVNGEKGGSGSHPRKGESKRVSHHLNLPQQIALVDAMKAQKERFERERPTLYQAASILSEIVGFAVSASNVSTTREALKMNWKPRPTGRPKKARPSDEDVLVLAEVLAETIAGLGAERPYELLHMIQRLKKKVESEAESEVEADIKPSSGGKHG